jgi:hypothetical protein
MLLCELFDPGDMTEQLRQAALDYLTPFMSQKVPFVTIDQMIDALRHSQFGLVINRAMIMDLLNPAQVEAVDKIEGDRIFLKDPDAVTAPSETDAEQQVKDQDHVADMAVDQIKQSLSQPAAGPAPDQLGDQPAAAPTPDQLGNQPAAAPTDQTAPAAPAQPAKPAPKQS